MLGVIVFCANCCGYHRPSSGKRGVVWTLQGVDSGSTFIGQEWHPHLQDGTCHCIQVLVEICRLDLKLGGDIPVFCYHCILGLLKLDGVVKVDYCSRASFAMANTIICHTQQRVL